MESAIILVVDIFPISSLAPKMSTKSQTRDKLAEISPLQ